MCKILVQNFIIKDILKKKNDVHWISVRTVIQYHTGSRVTWFHTPLKLPSKEENDACISSPEPKAHAWASSQYTNDSGVRPSIFSNIFSSETAGPIELAELSLMLRLLRMWERKFDQMVLVPRWPPCLNMVKKNFKNLLQTRRPMTFRLDL